MLTMEQVNEIEYFGEAEINGAKYTYKDYMYKSEIRKDGELYAKINNYLAVDDPDRVEYV